MTEKDQIETHTKIEGYFTYLISWGLSKRNKWLEPLSRSTHWRKVTVFAEQTERVREVWFLVLEHRWKRENFGVLVLC